MSTALTLIQIAELRKVYVLGNVQVRALDGINLDVPANAFLVAMGPSGSGKSTLLHLIGGLDRPSSGGIAVHDADLGSLNENELAAYRRSTVGFIFQSFNLIPSMTAVDNVAFPMRFARIPRKERRKRALELLEQVGLADRAFHRPTELSGGQQQRVAIARALVNNPTLILADEPTGNLDTTSGASIMQLLSDLHHQGRTVMVVTHDNRVKHFATDIIYLLDGRLVTEDQLEADALLSETTS